MAEFEKKEKYAGVWNGQQVAFNRKFSTHRFTDEECEALLRGETLLITGLVNKNGEEYSVKGKLDNCEFNGVKYVGFDQTEYIQVGIPKKYLKHEFTDDERNLLERGEKVLIKGYWSEKKQKYFDAPTKFNKDTGKFEFIFDN